MPLLPLHQEELSHHQRGYQDKDHLGMHGLVAAVLGVHTSMLDPEREHVRSALSSLLGVKQIPHLTGMSSLSATPVVLRSLQEHSAESWMLPVLRQGWHRELGRCYIVA